MKLSLWPGFLLLLLAANVGVVAVTMNFANKDGGPVLTPAYDSRAIRYDDFREEQHRSDALGWSLAARLVPTGEHRTELRLTLTGTPGSSPSTAGVPLSITLFHNAHPGERRTLRFTTDANGMISEELPDVSRGLHALFVESPATRERPLFRTQLEVATATGIEPPTTQP